MNSRGELLMNETYRNAMKKWKNKMFKMSIFLVGKGGFLGHPPREEQRTTEAYDAGYEDGQENLSNIGNWKK